MLAGHNPALGRAGLVMTVNVLRDGSGGYGLWVGVVGNGVGVGPLDRPGCGSGYPQSI